MNAESRHAQPDIGDETSPLSFFDLGVYSQGSPVHIGVVVVDVLQQLGISLGLDVRGRRRRVPRRR